MRKNYFNEIMKFSNQIPEGTVVRTILRTNELLKSYAKAAKLMGNVPLSQKFEDSSEAIQRDIIFAASLYFD